jgi:hypothetical protein
MNDFVQGGLLVLGAWALAYATTQFTEWRRREAMRRERREERQKDIYSRFLSELVGIPYSMDRALRLPDGHQQTEAIDDLGLRMTNVRAEVALFGSEQVRERSDEYPDVFQAYADRAVELHDEDANRPRDEREGVRSNTFKAYGETLRPFVKKLTEAMRKDMA